MQDRESRDKLRDHLAAHGVETRSFEGTTTSRAGEHHKSKAPQPAQNGMCMVDYHSNQGKLGTSQRWQRTNTLDGQETGWQDIVISGNSRDAIRFTKKQHPTPQSTIQSRREAKKLLGTGTFSSFSWLFRITAGRQCWLVSLSWFALGLGFWIMGFASESMVCFLQFTHHSFWNQHLTKHDCAWFSTILSG